MRRNFYRTAFNLKNLVRVLCNDPSARAEIEAGLAEGPAKPNTKVGVVNFGDRDNPDFYTAFVGTVQGKASGADGFVSRTQKSGHAVINLREQMQVEKPAQTQSAQASGTPELTSEQVAAILQNNPQLASLFGTAPSQAAAQNPQAAPPQPESALDQLSDMADVQAKTASAAAAAAKPDEDVDMVLSGDNSNAMVEFMRACERRGEDPEEMIAHLAAINT